MCGLVGILTRHGQPVDAVVLGRMARALRHRGPDGEGQFIDERVGFHHLRLAIIDLATGQQPMTRGPYTIIYNGEIYNYLELRDALIARGATFATRSDTEVILALYEAYGEDAIRQLNGMFAFLLYDRVRGVVVAARDHFGVKPLYYTAAGEQLAFASEVKALLQHPAVPRAPDHEALHEYLTFQYVLGERTLFRGIRKVLPGHYHVIDLATHATRVVRYWEPTFALDLDHTEAWFADEVARLITDAVRLQTRSDVPVGCYLSGGMDSSLVAVLAAPHLTGGVHTFTGAFNEGPEFNEVEYARMVVRAVEGSGAGSVTGHEVTITEQDFADLMPKLTWHMDEPAGGPGLLPQYAVSRLARQHVRVCLGGQGGDEIFGGYARYLVAYFEQALKGAIFETNEEQEHIVSLRSIVPNLPALQQYGPMLARFLGSEMFEPMDRRYFRLIDRSGGLLEYLSPAFRETRVEGALFGRFQAIFNHPDTLSFYNKMTHFDMVTGLPALLQVEDRVSMAVSLESRVPVLDHRLADLVASMPAGTKFRGGELKYILKRALGHRLPPEILSRKDKMGFPVPLHLWRGPALEFMRETLLSRRARERGLVDAAIVEKLMDRQRAFGRSLWGLLNLELWHRQFMDGDADILPTFNGS